MTSDVRLCDAAKSEYTRTGTAAAGDRSSVDGSLIGEQGRAEGPKASAWIR